MRSLHELRNIVFRDLEERFQWDVIRCVESKPSHNSNYINGDETSHNDGEIGLTYFKSGDVQVWNY